MIMFCRRTVLAADTAGGKLPVGIEGIIEGGHAAPLCRAGRFAEARSAPIRTVFHRPAAFCAAGRYTTCTFRAALCRFACYAGRSRQTLVDGQRGITRPLVPGAEVHADVLH